MVQQSSVGLGVSIVADWERETCWCVSTFPVVVFSTDDFRICTASFFGGIESDIWTLNVDSLWTGGPFQLEVRPIYISIAHHRSELD